MPDVFISHASEDKDSVARPLVAQLRHSGCAVWFDEATLTLGDSLRREIDRGLSACRYGVVILSPAFFRKEWPQRELDGLVARESLERAKRVLPVWHNVTVADVAQFSPVLADRLGINTARGIDAVAAAILQVLQADTFVAPGTPLAPIPPAHSHRLDEELQNAVSLARDYLLPQPLAYSEAAAALIRESLADGNIKPTRGDIAKYVRSKDASERVVGYLTCQVAAELRHDVSLFAFELLAALPRERAEASAQRETRPLWQLLVALRYVLRSPDIGSKAHHIRDGLTEMLRFLEQDASLDPGGECKGMIRHLLVS